MTPDSLSRGLGGRVEHVSKVVNTHLLVLASGGYTWLTLSRTLPYTSCGLHFRKSWHVRIDVYSIMNELFLSSVILSMLWHNKGANINNSSVTRFTCIYEILSNHPIQNRFLKDYSCTCKDRHYT